MYSNCLLDQVMPPIRLNVQFAGLGLSDKELRANARRPHPQCVRSLFPSGAANHHIRVRGRDSQVMAFNHLQVIRHFLFCSHLLGSKGFVSKSSSLLVVY
jgi:hypothetical protein